MEEQLSRAFKDFRDATDLHHHSWSSAANWKYVNAIVINEVTMIRMMKIMKRLLYILCKSCDPRYLPNASVLFSIFQAHF